MLFGEKKREKIFLLVDLGSASLGLAAVKLATGQKPHFLCHGRRPLAVNKLASLPEVFKKLSTDLENDFRRLAATVLKRKVAGVVGFLSAPWTKSTTQNLTFKKDRPLTVSNRWLQEILQKESAGGEKEFQLLDQKIVNFKINGYPTNRPFNKQGREISFSVFASLGQPAAVSVLQKTTGEIYHRPIIFHYFGLAAFSAVNQIFPETTDYLMAEISRETTELLSVNRGEIGRIFSFAGGREEFLDAVARDLSVAPPIALSFLKLYGENKLEKLFRQQLEVILEKVLWRKKFSASLDSDWPGRIFLVADSALTETVASQLKKAAQDAGRRPAVVTPLNDEIFNKFCRFESPPDPFLAIESMFLKLLLETNGKLG